jgi:hypothetical protein
MPERQHDGRHDDSGHLHDAPGTDRDTGDHQQHLHELHGEWRRDFPRHGERIRGNAAILDRRWSELEFILANLQPDGPCPDHYSKRTCTGRLPERQYDGGNYSSRDLHDAFGANGNAGDHQQHLHELLGERWNNIDWHGERIGWHLAILDRRWSELEFILANLQPDRSGTDDHSERAGTGRLP